MTDPYLKDYIQMLIDARLGESVRAALGRCPDVKLRAWADGVREMWGGDLSAFLNAVLEEMEQRE
jgi:hypothetical protein